MLPLKPMLALLAVPAFSVLALQGTSGAAPSTTAPSDQKAVMLPASSIDSALITPSLTKPFRITRLVLPKKMIENGPSKNMFVYWQGDPTFPVTLYIAEPTCAENVTCNSGHLTVLHRNNPIEWHDLWKCVGNVSSTMFNYNFWMVDAKGAKTQKVPADVLCTE
jgi:hypothetical protein